MYKTNLINDTFKAYIKLKRVCRGYDIDNCHYGLESESATLEASFVTQIARMNIQPGNTI